MFKLMRDFSILGFLCATAAYLRLFLRRNTFISRLEYARALSFSRVFDRKASLVCARDMTWLKYYRLILISVLAAKDTVLLVDLIVWETDAVMSPQLALCVAAMLCSLANLLFLGFFDRTSFLVNCAANLTFAVSAFSPLTMFRLPLPLWASGLLAGAAAANQIYFFRRRVLFFSRIPAPPPAAVAETLSPAERLEWMFSEESSCD